MKFLSCLIFASCLVASSQINAVVLNPGYPESIPTEKQEGESPLRRGEVIFFISYPFTFLGSFAAYGLAGYGMTALDGRNDFAPHGAFFGLVAVTAAFLSFGIAMNDYYAIKAETRTATAGGNPTGYLSLSYRF